ncbi:putative quinol monooxygenase [Thermaurantiacus sp.]
MLIVIGRAEADSADVAALRGAMADLMQATRAETGCISYSLAVEDEGGEERPATIAIAERWADEAALKAHMGQPHMSAFNAKAAGKLRLVEVKLYRAGEEIPFPR